MAFTKITGPGIHTLSNIMSHNVKSSGIITAVNGNLTGWLAVGSTASFGGDVSIGGTLTYDDVTNVEAVGIITAKTGIHVGAAGTIIHAVSSNDGKVGIGTENPSHKLDISGDGVAFPSAAGSTLLRLRDSAGTATLSIDAAAGSFSAIQFGDSAAASMGSILYNHVDDSMKFNTGGTGTKLFIASDGKVGIGTNDPNDKLSIHSAANSLVLGAKETTSQNHIFQILADDSAGNGELRLYRNSGSGTHEKTVEIASSGDSYFLQGSIGVGEETPDSKLDILHSSSTNPDTENLIHLRTDPGAGYVSRGLFIKIGRDLNYDNSGAYYDIVGSSGNSGFHAFQVQGNDILRINKDGNVGIGSTSPNLLNEPSKFRELTIGGRTEGAAIHLKDDNNNVQAGFFTSDNTGAMIIRTITNHPLMFRTNNAVRFFIDAGDPSGGGVGISTAGGTIAPDGNALLIRAKSSVGTSKGHIMLTGDGATVDEGPQIVFSESGSGSNYAGGSIGFHRKGSNSIGDLVFGTRESSGGPDTTTTERLRIASTGKIGFGDFSSGTSLSYPLHLKNAMGSSPSFIHMEVTGSNTVGGGGGIAFDTSASNSASSNTLYLATIAGIRNSLDDGSNDLVFSTSTNGVNSNLPSEKLRIYNNGAVLIGADANEAGGEAKLAIDCEGMNIFDDVGDPSNYGLIFANDPTTNKANGIGFFNDSASTCGGYIVHQDRGGSNIGDLLFGTASTADTPVERLRISSSGHVGINYGVNPNRYLQVRTIDGAAHNGVFAGENVNASNAATMFFLSTYRDSSSTEKFMQFNRDQDNNNQGVLAVFDVLTNGNVRNSNNSYSSISDVKLKENIIDASSQWDDIKNLRVRKFNFKSTPSETLIGVVAQEIETVSPGLVDDIPDMDLTKEGHEGTSTKSVKYSVLYMKAIKCLQEAQARIETLEAKVAALEGS